MSSMWMVKFFLIFIALLAMKANGEPIDYSKTSEAKSARFDKVVVRYFRQYGEVCANVQTLDPGKNWQIISTIHICSFEDKSFETEFADIQFQNIYFAEDGLHLTLSTTPLEPIGEQIKNCIVPIKDGSIDQMTCRDGGK